MAAGLEPFPQIIPGSQLRHISSVSNGAAFQKKPVRRRSSGLGGEIRAGDTGAPALATLDVRAPTPPLPANAQSKIDKAGRKSQSKRRKVRGLFSRWKRYAIKNTWVTPLVLLSVFLALFAVNPNSSNVISHFILLSYRIPHGPETAPGTPNQYGKGLWDIAFVAFYIIVLSFTREFIMQTVLRPFAINNGLKSRAKQARFMEQAYTAIYFGFSAPFGLYVMSKTDVWYFNVAGMYAGYPHWTHEAVIKFYYLFQAAYWAQQAIVLMLGMEKPRKDFNELVAHHIISLTLIIASYRFHFVYMGLAVFLSHDISDFFLATSKVLNYLDHFLVGPFFALFVCVWIYTRHYLNFVLLISEFYEFKTVGPYYMDWYGESFKCALSHYLSTALISGLQALNLFWLFYILRIAWRFIAYTDLADDRSDDDDEVEAVDDAEIEEIKETEKLKMMGVGLKSEDYLVEGRKQKSVPEVEVNGVPVTASGSAGDATGVETSGKMPKSRKQKS